MRWYIPAWAALGALGVAGFAIFRSGGKLALYDRQLGEAVGIANSLPGDWTKRGFESTEELLNTVDESPLLSRVVVLAHGGPDWFYDRRLTAERFGRALGRRLATRSVVGLAGCSAARNPGEADAWQPPAFSDGGERSYAGLLRDWINQSGGWWGEVRAHSLQGHVTANSSGRSFPFRERGRPGHAVMPQGYDMNQWIDEFTGARAQAWILGEGT